MSRCARSNYLSFSILLSFFSILLILLIGFVVPRTLLESLFIGKPIELSQVPCEFDKQPHWPDMNCYQMMVPESYDQPHVSAVTFPIIRISAINPSIDKKPLLHLGGGGPGYALGLHESENIDTYLSFYGDMSIYAGRDLYIMDPRGAGLSIPRLYCESCAYSNLSNLSKPLTLSESHDSALMCLMQCRAELISQDIALHEYHTDNVIQDIEHLRQALNIEQWNLYGVSYAGRYAMELASRYPETIKALILDSTVFAHIQNTSLLVKSTQAVFRKAIELCEDSFECLNKYPHLAEQFEQALQKLSSDPLVMTVNLFDSEHKVILDANRFLYILLNGFYEHTMFEAFPQIIHAVIVDNDAMLEQLLGDVLANEFNANSDFNLASYISHYCYDEYPFVDYDQLVQEVKSSAANSYIKNLLLHEVQLLRTQCKKWRNDQQDVVLTVKKFSKINTPTLFLHGGLGPVFPSEELHAQMSFFLKHSLIIFHDIAHGTIGTDICAAQYASAFLEDNNSTHIDMECF